MILKNGMQCRDPTSEHPPSTSPSIRPSHPSGILSLLACPVFRIYLIGKIFNFQFTNETSQAVDKDLPGGCGGAGGWRIGDI